METTIIVDALSIEPKDEERKEQPKRGTAEFYGELQVSPDPKKYGCGGCDG